MADVCLAVAGLPLRAPPPGVNLDPSLILAPGPGVLRACGSGLTPEYRRLGERVVLAAKGTPPVPVDLAASLVSPGRARRRALKALRGIGASVKAVDSDEIIVVYKGAELTIRESEVPTVYSGVAIPDNVAGPLPGFTVSATGSSEDLWELVERLPALRPPRAPRTTVPDTVAVPPGGAVLTPAEPGDVHAATIPPTRIEVHPAATTGCVRVAARLLPGLGFVEVDMAPAGVSLARTVVLNPLLLRVGQGLSNGTLLSMLAGEEERKLELSAPGLRLYLSKEEQEPENPVLVSVSGYPPVPLRAILPLGWSLYIAVLDPSQALREGFPWLVELQRRAESFLAPQGSGALQGLRG